MKNAHRLLMLLTERFPPAPGRSHAIKLGLKAGDPPVMYEAGSPEPLPADLVRALSFSPRPMGGLDVVLGEETFSVWFLEPADLEREPEDIADEISTIMKAHRARAESPPK